MSAPGMTKCAACKCVRPHGELLRLMVDQIPVAFCRPCWVIRESDLRTLAIDAIHAAALEEDEERSAPGVPWEEQPATITNGELRALAWYVSELRSAVDALIDFPEDLGQASYYHDPEALDALENLVQRTKAPG